MFKRKTSVTLKIKTRANLLEKKDQGIVVKDEDDGKLMQKYIELSL